MTKTEWDLKTYLFFIAVFGTIAFIGTTLSGSWRDPWVAVFCIVLLVVTCVGGIRIADFWEKDK